MDAIIIERSIWIAAAREKVWQAVTDPKHVAKWFAIGTEIVQTGDTFSIHMDGQDIEVAVIEVLNPPHTFTTRSLPDRALATTYTLTEEKGGTRVTVTETGYEKLSEADRKERMTQDSNGWTAALENLKAYLDGRPLPRPEGF